MEAFKVGVIPEGSDVVVSCVAPPGDFECEYRLGGRTYGYEGTPVLAFNSLKAAVEFLKFAPSNMKAGRQVILMGEVPDDAKPCEAVAAINSPYCTLHTEDILDFWRKTVSWTRVQSGGPPKGTLAAAWFRPLAEVTVSPRAEEWQWGQI